MLYLRICFDKPGLNEKRDAFRAAHRAYFQPNLQPDAEVRIVQAGPMCAEDESGRNIGSFMILEAPSLAEAQRFHDNDPFTAEGLFDRVDLCPWDRHIGG